MHNETVYLDLLPADRELYNEVKLFGAQKYEALMTTHKGILSFFEIILRLRQICNHSYLVAGSNDTNSSENKAATLFDKINSMKSSQLSK
jgi:SNF2 family DNA or RNA helicase